MSENESFIDEVTEEVRRDKLYLFFKRYGWIIVVLLLLIILTSVALEIRTRARVTIFEKRGDFLATLLRDESENIVPSDESARSLFDTSPLIPLLINSKRFEKEFDYENAKVTYETILKDDQFPSSFRDFAKFKLLLLVKDDPLKVERLLDELITPDNPFRQLALEQKVLLKIKERNWQDAQTILDTLFSDPGASRGLRSRAEQMQNAITFGGMKN